MAQNGEGEIRTPATLAGRPVFETGAFNHSATSPSGTRKLHDSLFCVKTCGSPKGFGRSGGPPLVGDEGHRLLFTLRAGPADVSW